MAIDYKVLFAVYGALADGNPDRTEAAIVTSALQGQLDNTPSGIVTINNTTMGGDPARTYEKHFGAVVEIDGTPRPFACKEGQTIDFS